MDPATAKTLVSALLVAAIALFSWHGFALFAREVAGDLRRARAAGSVEAPPEAPRDR